MNFVVIGRDPPGGEPRARHRSAHLEYVEGCQSQIVYGRPMLAIEAQQLLETEGGQASTLGHKFSRAPRTKMLRSAILEIGGVQHSVRIRNISRTGAMIDGFESGQVGDEVLIELMDDQMFRAHLRWMQNGKAGLEFAEAFNLERLKTAPEPRPALWRV